MSFVKKTSFVTLVFCLTACTPLNRFTVGKNNIEGIDMAVNCNMDGALQSIKKSMESDVEGYRRISYELTVAIHKELKQTSKVEETVQIFKNDPKMTDKDEAKFLSEASCFQDYLNKRRLEKNHKSMCESVN